MNTRRTIMKRKSNIAIGHGKATIVNAKHNDRSKKPNYLIEKITNPNWVSCNWKIVENELMKHKKQVEINRKLLGKKKISSQVHILKEFIINLEYYHTEKTMYGIGSYLKKYYGIHIIQMSIHRDEGIFLEKYNVLADKWDLNDFNYDSEKKVWKDSFGIISTEIIVYRPNCNIFWDEETESWYHDREFTNILDMKKVKKKINYHGHILFFNLDESGNTIARTLRPHLSKIQDDIAKITGLPRASKSRRKGQKHQKFKKDAAISEHRQLIEEYHLHKNLNTNLLHIILKLNKRILNETTFNEKSPEEIVEVVEKQIKMAISWKYFATRQYQILGFKYNDGDKIDIKQAIKRIKNKLSKYIDFEREVYKMFGIEKNTHKAEAIEIIKTMLNGHEVISKIN